MKSKEAELGNEVPGQLIIYNDREKHLMLETNLPEGRKSPRAKTKPKTTTATPTPICQGKKRKLN